MSNPPDHDHMLVTGDCWKDVLAILSAPAPIGAVAPLERKTYSLAARGALPLSGRVLRQLAFSLVFRHQTSQLRSASPHFRDDPWYVHVANYGLLWLAVEAFEEITGRRANSGAIRAMLLLRDVVHDVDAAMDAYPGFFSPHKLSDLQTIPAIARGRAELNAWLRVCGIGDEAMKMLDTLRQDALAAIASTAVSDPSRCSFIQALAAAHCDSGILLRLFGDMVTIMSGLKPDDRIRSEFYLVGLIGKFSDDGTDIGPDFEFGQANLFIAAAREEKSEWNALLSMPQEPLLSLRRFAKACPRSYARCCGAQRTLVPFLQTRSMRIACDVAALRVRHP